MARRSLRILKYALILAVPVAFLALFVQGYVVRNAVVTAETITVRSPIDGQVVESSLAGGRMADGTHGLKIVNPRSDPRALDNLTAELNHILHSLEGKRAEMKWFDTTIAASEERLRATLSGMRLELQLEYDIVISDMKALESRIEYLSAQYERAQRLQGSATSQAALDAAEADLEEARQTMESLRLRAEQIEQRENFLDQSLPLSTFADHAVILSDRIDAMKVQRRELVTEIAEMESHIDWLHGVMESEEQVYNSETHYESIPPASSIIWEVYAGPGANVTPGMALYTYLNCEERLVMVTVDDATTELLGPDHPVSVSLYGESETIPGRVQAIFGSSSGAMVRDTLAARVSQADESDAIVLVAIAPADEDARDHRLCDVGRTAFVAFEGISFIDPLLNRLW